MDIVKVSGRKDGMYYRHKGFCSKKKRTRPFLLNAGMQYIPLL